MASTIKRDLRTEVRRFEDLNAPVLEYQFSQRNFTRPVNSRTGIYNQGSPESYKFNQNGNFTFQDKVDFEFNV